MTGTNPKGLRFHLLNADIDDAVILHLWYQDTLRKDVYKVSVANVCLHAPMRSTPEQLRISPI